MPNHYEIVTIDGHEVKVKQLTNTVVGVCQCGATAQSATLIQVERMIHHIHHIVQTSIKTHLEEDAIYIRWDTKVDSPWGERQPYPLSFHKTLDGALSAITPAFRNLTKDPSERYIHDFTHEAIERRVLSP